jgi:type IV secretory pathway TrbD component
MPGTIIVINKATNRPLLVMGVEKRLAMVNAIIGFSLVAAAHFKMPASLVGVGIYCIFHGLLVLVSKQDPMIAKLFKRSTRYSLRCYFPAKSHPLRLQSWPVLSISRPRSLC